jgi:hypothetical protein
MINDNDTKFECSTKKLRKKWGVRQFEGRNFSSAVFSYGLRHHDGIKIFQLSYYSKTSIYRASRGEGKNFQ